MKDTATRRRPRVRDITKFIGGTAEAKPSSEPSSAERKKEHLMVKSWSNNFSFTRSQRRDRRGR